MPGRERLAHQPAEDPVSHLARHSPGSGTTLRAPVVFLYSPLAVASEDRHAGQHYRQYHQPNPRREPPRPPSAPSDSSVLVKVSLRRVMVRLRVPTASSRPAKKRPAEMTSRMRLKEAPRRDAVMWAKLLKTNEKKALQQLEKPTRGGALERLLEFRFRSSRATKRVGAPWDQGGTTRRSASYGKESQRRAHGCTVPSTGRDTLGREP